MAGDECEIEYLDEDEELVQQCMQIVQTTPVPDKAKVESLDSESNDDLLVERKFDHSAVKRRNKTEEEDSDYDPRDDMLQLKKKKIIKKPPKRIIKIDSQQVSFYVRNNAENVQKPLKTYSRVLEQGLHAIQKKTASKMIKVKEVRPVPRPVTKTTEEMLKERKKLDIRIPDFEDPLCLPVRAFLKDNAELKKLKSWNNLCLSYLTKGNEALETRGKINSSKRTVVLSNSRNRIDGKVETSVWSKIYVETDKGETKMETYRSILPRYREKKMPKQYNLNRGVQKQFKNTYDVILTKESQKDEEFLVVYKPDEALSAVYKFDKKKTDETDDENKNLGLKETTCCKVCAPCYQVSWRGVRKDSNTDKDTIKCAICQRNYVSVYNLLAHLKTHHTNLEVRKHQGQIAKALATIVDYHYKCRICQEQFLSIKQLRSHVFTHKGTEIFKCEVGNHMAS